jgi:predicted RNase H-related nuclease YkuK (DUF458 family)
MFKIERTFKPSEVLADFHRYKEETGHTPKIHIGTDSQIQKFGGSPSFRFVTVVCLHNNVLGESGTNIAKLWSFHDFQRSKDFANTSVDKEKIRKMLRKTYIGDRATIDDDHQAMNIALEEVSTMFALNQTEGNLAFKNVNAHALVIRMMSEACRSIAAANALTDERRDNGVAMDSIHIGIDINSKEEHLSNRALSTVKGMLNSLGYENVLWKPDSMITYAADRLSK